MTIKEITDYIFLENKDLKGDIAFVFGTWFAFKESCQKSAELYKNGLVKKIIVSGGKNSKTGIVEGDVMAKEIEVLGVSAKDILVENKSTNTLENVLFSKEVLDKEIGLKNIKIITAVVKSFHARRAIMTLKKHMSEHITYKVCAYLPQDKITKENWFESEKGVEKVMGEMEKIKKYLAKGDIAEI